MDDLTQILVAIGVVINALVVLVNLIVSISNHGKISVVDNKVHELHIEVDSRLSQAMESEKARVRAEGVLEGMNMAQSPKAIEASVRADVAGETAHAVTSKASLIEVESGKPATVFVPTEPQEGGAINSGDIVQIIAPDESK